MGAIWGKYGADMEGKTDMAESIVLNMDCMEYMRQLPDKAFDLAIVDPVYGDVTRGGVYAQSSIGRRC